MKQGILILTALITVFTLQSCRKVWGDGPVVTESRNVTGFTSIDAGIDGDVYFTPSAIYSVEIHAQRNILDIIQTEVVGGELRLEFKHNRVVGHHDRVVVYISGPSVGGFGINGSGNIRVTDSLKPTNLSLNVNGSGSITLGSVVTNNITAKISGSGDITVNGGSANNETLKISGSGNINLFEVPVNTAQTQTSGSGTTKVNVNEHLDVTISGSGDVIYKGHPTVSTSISGSGKVLPY